MLEINEQLLDIEDCMDELIAALKELPAVKEYQMQRHLFLSDSQLQEKIKAFQNLKENYDSQKDYVQFRPDLKQARRDILRAKRELDLNERVIAFRQSEVAVQEILADLSQKLSQAISSSIFVDTGLPLAPHKPHHAKGRGNNIKERGTDV